MVGVVGSSPIAPTKQNPLCWAVWKGDPKGSPFLRLPIRSLLEPFDQGGKLRAARFDLREALKNFCACVRPMKTASDVVQSTCVRLLMLLEAHQVQRQQVMLEHRGYPSCVSQPPGDA
jgi:hypothetical protein